MVQIGLRKSFMLKFRHFFFSTKIIILLIIITNLSFISCTKNSSFSTTTTPDEQTDNNNNSDPNEGSDDSNNTDPGNDDSDDTDNSNTDDTSDTDDNNSSTDNIDWDTITIEYTQGSEDNTYYVKNPTSGASQYVKIFYPSTWNESEDLPAIILVPGGMSYSILFTKNDHTISAANENNIIYVVYDPEGRGNSDGTENYGGSIHQDGLAAVLKFITTSVDGIKSDSVGFGTNSFGVTIASGALMRYPSLPAKFLIDFEGPANRNDTANCDESGNGGHLTEVAECDDEEFWSEREAINFVGSLSVPYLRIQTETDHVQPDNSHAIQMINTAVSGTTPWVRLNADTPNQTYSSESEATFADDSIDVLYFVSPMGDYAKELLELDLSSSS